MSKVFPLDTHKRPLNPVHPAQARQLLRNRKAAILKCFPFTIILTTDYRSKRSEYAVLEIPEYWIVDPIQEVVTVCTLVEGFYDAVAYVGEERIISPTFPELDLSAQRVLTGWN